MIGYRTIEVDGTEVFYREGGDRTATATGIDFDSFDVETSGNAGGLFYAPKAPGTARFLVDRDRRVLIGSLLEQAGV